MILLALTTTIAYTLGLATTAAILGWLPWQPLR